jgi:hypothetical protein
MIVRDRNDPSILLWESANAPIDHAFDVTLRDTVVKWDTLMPRAQEDRGNDQSDMVVDQVIACSLDGCEGGLHCCIAPTKPAFGAEGFYTKGVRFDYDGELNFAQVYMQNWKYGKYVKAFGMCQWYMAESPGESGVGRNFACSMMDWNRIPKMLYKMYQACWVPYSVRPVVSLAHHWNRSGAITVNAFSNCPSVRLLINGVKQGDDQTPYPDTGNANALFAHQCSWNVTWQAGTVTAEGLDSNQNVVCTDQKVTAGNPDHIALSVAAPVVNPATGDTFHITANATDAAFILATVVDANGNWCPTDSHIITFSVSGPGNYRGGADQMIGPGGANYHAPGDPNLSAEGGMCKVAVRSTFIPGVVTVTATSPGLGQGTASFTVYPVPAPPPVSVLPSVAVHAHRAALDVRFKQTGAMLQYHLSGAAKVSFDVVDAGGKIVARVPRSLQTQGWHPVLGLPAALANGVYLIRCIIDGQEFVKRMVVAR